MNDYRVIHRNALAAALFATIALSVCAPARAGVAEDCASLDPNVSTAGCSAIIETGPTRQVDTAMAYANRGRAYLVLGDFAKALADLDEAVRQQPRYAAAYSHRGNAYLASGRTDLALADYTRAIELDPSN